MDHGFLHTNKPTGSSLDILNDLFTYVGLEWMTPLIPLLLFFPILLAIIRPIFSISAFTSYLWAFITRYCTYTVYVTSEDPIFNTMKIYISDIQGIAKNRVLRVETHNSPSSHLQNEEPQLGFSFFLPSGVTMIAHNGRYWFFDLEESYNESSYELTERSKLRISCFALSKAPIEKLLREGLEKEHQKKQGHTRIYQPHPNYQTRFAFPWEETQPRRNRDLETVVLDPKMKKMVLDDMMAYVSPESSDWYVSRGVPHRRGYLFHGPPGTGKSSFCLALAGKLGLCIHTLSLQSSNMTDDGLSFLLSKLEGQCIVLLEDIDALDFNRDSNESPKDITQGNSKKTRGISLSGLLNAIDGVAAHEGRVLIMTTNKLKSLDKALIRPGRIDLEVLFKNITSKQAAELFRLMYRDVEMEKLPDRSREFGQLIPDGKFSHAELQGFFLKWKTDPLGAMQHIPDWIQSKSKSNQE